MNLTSGVKWADNIAEAQVILLHAYDHVLFSHDFVGDEEVWAQTLKTLRHAKWNVISAAIDDLPGMRGL